MASKHARQSLILMVALIMLAGTTFAQDRQREGQQRERRQPGRQNRVRQGPPRRAPDKLKVGDPAPDFTLQTLDGKATVQLSTFADTARPVALIFGSYT